MNITVHRGTIDHKIKSWMWLNFMKFETPALEPYVAFRP